MNRVVVLAALFLSVATGRPAYPNGDLWRDFDDVAFRHDVLASATAVTSLAVDDEGGWLYGVTLAGLIHRWPIDPEDGSLGEIQTLELPHFKGSEAPRGLVGLAVDPLDNRFLWVTDNYPVALFGANEDRPDFSGRLSRIRLDSGLTFSGRAETYIHGLPRSCGDHLSNSLIFRENPDFDGETPPYLLYLTQGSNSSMGEADRSWCHRPERLLTAAVLEIDPYRATPPGGFDVRTEPVPEGAGHRRFGYSFTIANRLWSSDDGDLKNGGLEIDEGPWEGDWLHFDARGVATVRDREEGGAFVAAFYDPFAEDAPLRLFATGVRNGYDLAWHSNGWLYVASNGPVAGGAAPDDPRTPQDETIDRASRTQDYLYQLRRGAYAGHPNPLRNEFVAHGGNPTSAADPHEIEGYPVGVDPHPRYRVERVYPLGFHRSPNGMTEYDGPAKTEALNGALIVAQYGQDNNIRALALNPDGSVDRDQILRDPSGAEIVYRNPLDVVNGHEGRIYLATLDRSNGQSKIVLLTPAARSAD